MDENKQTSTTFNYSDVFFTFLSADEVRCTHMVKDHTLVYIYSGELALDEHGENTVIRAGECVFLRRDNRVSLTKQPGEDKYFSGIFMVFSRNFLREFFNKIDKAQVPDKAGKFGSSIVKLPQTPDIASLFQSMVPYFDTSVKPSDELMKLKQHEGTYSLLNIDKRFFPTLFDFTEPWKIDILEFLENNYMYDLSMEEIASFTGRSLATFKRDFKKISDLTPQKWLIQKRLEVAYAMIREDGKRASDVYLEVGFKNLSHFSTAFKRQFGHSPRN